MDDHPGAEKPPQEWLDALARGEADAAAGRVVSGEDVMRRLRQTIDDMEATTAAGPHRATPHR